MPAMLVAILCLVIAAPLLASEHDSRAPAAAEVIAGIYRFDRFQQNAMDGADIHGGRELSAFAAARADAAAQRDKELKRIQLPKGAAIDAWPSPWAGGMLANVEASEGPAYIRKFYQAQAVEYQLAISLLESYLQEPDSKAVAAFARRHLPKLRTELKDVQATVGEK